MSLTEIIQKYKGYREAADACNVALGNGIVIDSPEYEPLDKAMRGAKIALAREYRKAFYASEASRRDKDKLKPIPHYILSQIFSSLYKKRYETCPCCNFHAAESIKNGIMKCTNCGAVYGVDFFCESHIFVLNEWEKKEVAQENWKYYDFIFIEFVPTQMIYEIRRRHGWFNIKGGKILQTG